MRDFKGFREERTHFTSLPEQFFSELLAQIDHLGELKLTVYFFWRLERLEGVFRYLERADIAADQSFMEGLQGEEGAAVAALDEALERAVARGTLLRVVSKSQGGEGLYFLNSPKGRAAVEAIQQGKWQPGERRQPAPGLVKPNVFQLYEEHIGPLTPMIAEKLQDAERSYPQKWIEEAIRIAVENNKRSWSYAEAILRRWQERGRDDGEDRQDTERDRRRYVEGEFADFIEH